MGAKKHAKKRQSLRDMAYETTPAQRLMRGEMESGVHKPERTPMGPIGSHPSDYDQPSAALAAVTPPSHELDSSIVSGGKPQKLAEVFDSMMGSVGADANVTRMAHVLIEAQGEGLQLGLKQWGIVQRIVEAAVRFDPADL
ncbi:hypothetical protein SEA_JEMERALD_63 [Microbacterium phage Jemerald]|nr:hypothetical protein SEA_JUICER_63 [Microbacterium phage Juicer]WNO27302.1 hypothetical protein SEA_JEMERALD_63 [Microbacterium phage Jemerald]